MYVIGMYQYTTGSRTTVVWILILLSFFKNSIVSFSIERACLGKVAYRSIIVCVCV
jgi:hypothetical protein